VLTLISFHFSGIGLESSILFAQEGANVLLVDINIEAVQGATEIIRQKQPDAKVLAIRADVGQEEDVKAAVDTAIKEFGRLDVMVPSIPFYYIRRDVQYLSQFNNAGKSVLRPQTVNFN